MAKKKDKEIVTNKAVQKYLPRIVQSIIDQEKSKEKEKLFEQLQKENKFLNRRVCKDDALLKENDRLRALCWRESQVLKEALKRKNNKSMIKVVADSLEEQWSEEIYEEYLASKKD